MQFLRIIFLLACFLFIIICINAAIYNLVGKVWLEFLIGAGFIAVTLGLSLLNSKLKKPEIKYGKIEKR